MQILYLIRANKNKESSMYMYDDNIQSLVVMYLLARLYSCTINMTCSQILLTHISSPIILLL